MDKQLKQRIRKFYEQEITNRSEESIIYFKDKDFKIGAVGYNPENLLDEGETYQKLSPSPLSISISEREQVPKNVLNACDRISWYLKHSLGTMNVIKVPFENTITFAICIEGYVDDGWDNSGSFIEIYNYDGELIGTSRIPGFDGEDNFKWVNRPIKHFDFDDGTPSWWENEQRRGREVF